MQFEKPSGPFILTGDIGGSHITTGICNLEDYTILPDSLARTEFSSKVSANHILDSWAGAFKTTIKNADVNVAGVALAMPGPFDYENGISYIKGLNKYEALYGMNIKEHLTHVLNMPARSIRFRNDAEAAIAGEVAAGAGKTYKNVVGVTLGTGFGSAHFSEGLTRDLNLGSEAFSTSIADDILSTRWFLGRYWDMTGISVTGVKEMASLADENKLARDLFKEFAKNFSDFMLPYLEKLQPDVLVICGNIARASHLFLPQVKKRINHIPIKLAELGENAALMGAASLFDPIPIT